MDTLESNELLLFMIFKCVWRPLVDSNHCFADPGKVTAITFPTAKISSFLSQQTGVAAPVCFQP